MPQRPDLVVSGINYGENMGIGISVSGTVGAALEAIALGVPALAISLETEKEHHLSYSDQVDFSKAAYFTSLFARKLLEKRFPPETNLLKVDVPKDATTESAWRTTHLSSNRYYNPLPEKNRDWSKPSYIDYDIATLRNDEPQRSDVYILRKERKVTVTPLTLNFTSRVDLDEFDAFLRA